MTHIGVELGVKAKTTDILQHGLTLPVQPTAVLATGEGVAGSVDPALDPATIAFRLGQALELLRQRVIGGDRTSAVALSLLPENPGRFATAVAERLMPTANKGLAASALFYEGAVAAAAEGRSEEAALLLAALLADDRSRLDGLVGLAVLALRAEAYDAALALAQDCLQLSVKHPRACCIAGLCELERGDRKAAQNYFAAAARIARTRPEFREDLQTAQRALLMMHLA